VHAASTADILTKRNAGTITTLTKWKFRLFSSVKRVRKKNFRDGIQGRFKEFFGNSENFSDFGKKAVFVAARLVL
jgi:hypothetical protein